MILLEGTSRQAFSWLRRALHRTVVALLVAGCLLMSPSTALAQRNKKEPEPETKSYVLPYMIVIMMVSLGLMTICRPSKRKDKPDEIKEEEG